MQLLLGLLVSLLSDVLPEIAFVDESLDLILQLEAFVGIVTVVMMEAAVLPLVSPHRWSFHRWWSVEVLLALNLHEDLSLRSSQRDVAVVAPKGILLPRGF